MLEAVVMACAVNGKCSVVGDVVDSSMFDFAVLEASMIHDSIQGLLCLKLLWQKIL